MRRVELSTLSLLPKYRAHLVKAQLVYADQVLLATPSNLARLTKLSVQDCNALLAQVANAVIHTVPTQDDDDDELAVVAFTTGDSELDHFFDAYPGRGGIRLGHITELAGQSSSGKTNLCLQIACTVQLAPHLGGVDGGAIFLSSEGTLPSRRLVQLATHFASLDTTITATRFLDNVHVETAPDADTLVALLTYHVPTAIERINHDPDLLPIRLVIVDSIAAPFRSAHETGSNGFAQRAKELAEIGDALKTLAARYHLAVVVVNQVSDVWDARSRNLPPSFLLDDNDNDEEEEEVGGDQDGSGGDVPTRAAGVMAQTPASLIKPRINRPPTPIGTEHPHPRRTSSHTHGYGLPPPPHRQYSFPSLLYSRFQSPHLTGSFSSVSHPSLLPLPPGFSAPSSSSSSSLEQEQQQQPVAAALGHTWSQIPTSRILCLVRRELSSSSSSTRTRRCMTMVWSPFAPRGCIEYEIDPDLGIVGRGEVRVRAVPGHESYEQEVEEEEGDVGGGGDGGGGDAGSRDKQQQQQQQHNHNEAGDRKDDKDNCKDDADDDDDEKQYWGSTEDLLLHYDEHDDDAKFIPASGNLTAVAAAAAVPI